MSFRNACFISYAHGRKTEKTKVFIADLIAALDEGLDQLMAEPIVTEKDVEPGDLHDRALARYICESVCSIVVYSPLYEGSAYCRREFAAMLSLEPERQKLLGNSGAELGMIIPIVLAGIDDLPPEIKDRRLVSDMSHLWLTSARLSRHPDFAAEVQKICQAIVRRYRAFQKLNAGREACKPCPGIQLPEEKECPPWRYAPLPAHAGFPGREETA